MFTRLRLLVAATLVSAAAVSAQPDQPAAAPTFRITFDPALQPGPYTGRVYLALTQNPDREPRQGMTAWFNPPPLFSMDVKDIPPGGSATIDATALYNPTPLDSLPPGEWRIQVVARRSLDSSKPGQGEGDLYSEVQTITLPGAASPVELRLTNIVHEEPFQETDNAQLFEIVSPSLSRFFGREFRLRAGVVLPDGWADHPDEHYPAIYFVPGFGGDHRGATRKAARRPADDPARQCLEVVLDPSCFRGHSVFADSANNGPWGTALVEELIPALEAKYRGPQSPNHRYVTGGSSGGWASLWLMVAYPDDFASCWSHCPDPVDFRAFQSIDLYKPGVNMYTDEEGNRRPIARQGDQVTLWCDDFVARETVLGPGGQIHSFEACFSPRGPDGQPLLVFDRKTGAVNADIAKTWEKYDIRLVLERSWPTLGPKLAGKLHIFAGGADTFYLEGAVKLLKPSLEQLGSDAEVVIVPGMAHQKYTIGEAQMYQAVLSAWAHAQPAGAAPAGN